VQALIRALTGGGESRLDVAALDLATVEFPSLVAGPYLERLDEMGLELGDETAGMNGPEFLSRANTYLFEDLGFRGNEGNYYDPRNSCLNWVLDQRTGIPITLSLVYLEIARRLRRPISGIGLPGHFVVKYDDGNYVTYLDPFDGGKLLDEDECRELARSIVGADALSDPRLLRPVGPQYILIRMLNNLRAAYFQREDFGRAAQVLDLLVQSSPATPDYYKGRAIANVHLRQFRAASADFEEYLRLCPEAEDREEVVKQLVAIHRWLSSLN
jgi:regulator of sirC expression with transglutaminase-like and TPR domain